VRVDRCKLSFPKGIHLSFHFIPRELANMRRAGEPEDGRPRLSANFTRTSTSVSAENIGKVQPYRSAICVVLRWPKS